METSVRRCGRALAGAALVLVALAGCAGGGDGGSDVDGVADPSTGASTSTMPTTTTTTVPTTLSPPPSSTTVPPSTTTVPPGAVVPVPTDLALARLVPMLPGEPKVSERSTFDTRLCDGRTVDQAPVAQASVIFEEPRRTTSVGIYRFTDSDPNDYLAEYGDSLQACTVAEPEAIEEIDIGPEGAYLVWLETDDTIGFVLLAVTDDLFWVVYQRAPDEVEVTDELIGLVDAALTEA